MDERGIFIVPILSVGLETVDGAQELHTLRGQIWSI